MPRKLYYTANQAAKLLKTSRATVYRRMRDGKIKTLTVGGYQFISADEIDRLKADRLTITGIAVSGHKIS